MAGVCVSERNTALVLIHFDPTALAQTWKYLIFQLFMSHKNVLLSELLPKSPTWTKASSLSESSYKNQGLTLHSELWAAPHLILELRGEHVTS